MEHTAKKDQDPPAGGSYLRLPDGSLKLQSATKPAPPSLATEPKPAEKADADEE